MSPTIQERDKDKKAGSWLMEKIKEFHDNEQRNKQGGNLRIPMTFDDDGNPKCYTANGCNMSQKEILTVILKKLHEYIHFKQNKTNTKTFTPLRMTIMGAAGTGKSYLINTITTIIRLVFQDNDIIHVTGPTGEFHNAL